MGIHVALEHRTTYEFDRTVTINPHSVRLRPAAHARTPIHAYDLAVSPDSHFVNWQQDPFGNFTARLAFPEPAAKLEIAVNLVAEMTVINPFDFFVDEQAEHYSFSYQPQLKADLSPYLGDASATPGPHLAAWLAKIPSPDGTQRTVDFLVDLNQRLAADLNYSIRLEPGVQDPDETLRRRVGSCRDSAWLLVHALRHLGLAARFVSGYLVQLRADQPTIDGPDGPTEDFTDLHAWAEVYIPGAGWIGLDPTSGLFAGEGHIPLAASPHPASAAPIVGSTDTCEVEFSFENVVTRIREDPRVTLPYNDEQWRAIDVLGNRVDERLTAGDVRLTMGGEPTFVSIDDMDGAEWNHEADSVAKKSVADELTERLKQTYAPDGLVQFGQGKWYPGEPLPRWRNTIFWRTDGFALWNEQNLLVGNESAAKQASGRPETSLSDMASFTKELAYSFGLDPNLAVELYEDPVPELWAEAKNPEGPAPDETSDWFGTSPADNADQSTNASADQPCVGFALPLHSTATGWASSTWTVRRDRAYLVPGQSPAGLRLPLDSLTWSSTPNTYEAPTFDSQDALPEPGQKLDRPAEVVAVHSAPPTAVTMELRDGQLTVFLPPLESVNHAIDLLATIETIASKLDVPIQIEGYELPRHPGLRSLSVTPDPGVVEVNVQPSTSWEELAATTKTLYEQARACRLGTEKFDLDGTHTGTGGGNHITLGGVNPSQSPLLRRPDLLRSLLTFWQRHPSLSYVFSGQFVGPTSQAPRIDEARHDSLDELEIAFTQMAAATSEALAAGAESLPEAARLEADGMSRADVEALGEAAAAKPWLVDRLFRNILADLSGNTHRSEFCIDKLYSPDSATGRLGILELRAFEMPPHHQMAMVQALLIRTLVARFWEDPYVQPLHRWGTELHDRFMSSTAVRDDLASVAADLNAHGFDFDATWLEPFLEFRFPLLGETQVDGTRFALRTAIEPWHVLAEQDSEAGTSRYVDSSVERVELIVGDYDRERHIIAVNGQPIPLRDVDHQKAVASIRFKAWAPPSSLHPTIAPHSPLRFDVVSRPSGRSLGGFTYHTTHPGGRSYDTFPVNASEAEARRCSRFTTTGRDPNLFDTAAMAETIQKSIDRHPDAYSSTLDLRRTTTDFHLGER